MNKITKIELTVSSLEIANTVLEKLNGMAEKYGQVSVADYNDLVGMNSDLSHHTVGWVRGALSGIKPEKTGRQEYTIKFPLLDVLL